MRIIPYDRLAAFEYARQWAYSRNPNYYDFSAIGGDCTAFASQCLFAGCGVMNYTPDIGWFYRSPSDRAAAWTGVEFFYRFLTDNAEREIGNGAGPFAKEVGINEVEIGDFIQLGKSTGEFYHTLTVVGFSNTATLVAAHSYDAFNRPLTSYSFEKLRCLHVLGARRKLYKTD
jgi:hypothetical protein